MSDNSNLHIAKGNKNDEFYTQLSDIENELKHYKQHFKNKVVFCNCDDPYESNFFKYFAMNFNSLGLKKLITTGYATSPIIGEELSLFPDDIDNKAYVVYINEVIDFNNDGRIDLFDVKTLLKNKNNCRRKLKGETIYDNEKEIVYPAGDFRSNECIKLLKEADIVVTNPPFSLFREYVAQLIKYNKQFLIIGNQNVITYKEIFPLIKNNKMWLGYHHGHTWFKASPDYEIPENYLTVDKKKMRSNGYMIDEHGNVWRNLGNICWFTNLDIKKRHEDLILYKKYSPKEYLKYDNYNAINVDKVKDIPYDYNQVMGVPISFMDKYNPNQFEIIGATQRGCHDELPDTKKYDDYWEVRQDGTKTGSSGNKTNENANLKCNDGKKNYFINKDGDIIQSAYQRIFIRAKKGCNL